MTASFFESLVAFVLARLLKTLFTRTLAVCQLDMIENSGWSLQCVVVDALEAEECSSAMRSPKLYALGI